VNNGSITQSSDPSWALQLDDLYQPYFEEFVGKIHLVFYNVEQSTILAVSRFPEHFEKHRALFLKPSGYEVTTLHIPSCSSERKFVRNVLHLLQEESLSKGSGIKKGPIIRLSIGSRGPWLLARREIAGLIVALEAKLSYQRQITVGLICSLPEQTQEEMMQNPRNLLMHEFMVHKLGCSLVNINDWTGYAGMLDSCKNQQFYYTKWIGFDIVFHVAPFMDTDRQRQFIGNDKVLLYWFSRQSNDELFLPQFRSKVNSVAVVVSPSVDKEDHYQIGCYHRKGVDVVSPMLPDDPISKIRDVLLCKLVNAYPAALRGVYGSRLTELRKTNIDELFEKQRAFK
jgi:hypothetical protein